jgi:hypothetical protein
MKVEKKKIIKNLIRRSKEIKYIIIKYNGKKKMERIRESRG